MRLELKKISFLFILFTLILPMFGAETSQADKITYTTPLPLSIIFIIITVVIAIAGVFITITRSRQKDKNGNIRLAFTLEARIIAGFTIVGILFIGVILFVLAGLIEFGEEVAEVNELDIHITEVVSRLEARQMEQSIILERAIRHAGGTSEEEYNEFQEEIKNFKEFDTVIEDEISGVINYILSIDNHSKEEAEYAKELIRNIEQIKNEHHGFSQNAHALFNMLKEGTSKNLSAEEEAIGMEADDLDHHIEEFLHSIEVNTEATLEELKQNENITVIVVIILVSAAVILAVLIILLISRNVFNQLGRDPAVLSAIVEDVSLGDLSLNTDQIETAKGVYKSILAMVKSLKIKSSDLEAIANGDLTITVTPASDVDSLGHSLLKMKDSLRMILESVRSASDQVTAGAEQVNQASQSLSGGASEQASSLEEISSSATEINTQSKQNAKSARNANLIAREAMETAEKGNQQVHELTTAMEKINISSDQIKKITKVIDDIAFQINLLALNANVEAARAGKYGRGFAVVADEVRNLANRSAEAVKETTAMVEESIANIDLGTHAAIDTAEQLHEIVTRTGNAAVLLDEITAASEAQAQAIDQISQGLEQIDAVTQDNTASAEECAAAAEELSAQATELHHKISRFKLT